jgi:hypothetical protein
MDRDDGEWGETEGNGEILKLFPQGQGCPTALGDYKSIVQWGPE